MTTCHNEFTYIKINFSSEVRSDEDYCLLVIVHRPPWLCLRVPFHSDRFRTILYIKRNS